MASNGKKGSGNAAPTQNEQKKPTEQAEKKNNAVQSETVQQPIPYISVRIDKLFDDDTKKLKAFASANIGPFAVHGIRVFENEKGMFVNMPSVSYKAVVSAKTAIESTSGEGYIDTGVKIIIGVVIGGVILAGLYLLFNGTIIPTLTTKIGEMFNYGG